MAALTGIPISPTLHSGYVADRPEPHVSRSPTAAAIRRPAVPPAPMALAAGMDGSHRPSDRPAAALLAGAALSFRQSGLDPDAVALGNRPARRAVFRADRRDGARVADHRHRAEDGRCSHRGVDWKEIATDRGVDDVAEARGVPPSQQVAKNLFLWQAQLRAQGRRSRSHGGRFRAAGRVPGSISTSRSGAREAIRAGPAAATPSTSRGTISAREAALLAAVPERNSAAPAAGAGGAPPRRHLQAAAWPGQARHLVKPPEIK